MPNVSRYYPTYDPSEAERDARDGGPIDTYDDLDTAMAEADRLATSFAFHAIEWPIPPGVPGKVAHVYDFQRRRSVYVGVIRPELFAGMGEDEDESNARLDALLRLQYGEAVATAQQNSPQRIPHWTIRVARIVEHLQGAPR